MSLSARSTSSFVAIALWSTGAVAQPAPTAEEEVIAMLREWRAVRAAKGADPVPTVLAGSSDPIVRIRVGEKVQQMALTSGSQPDYPEEARAKGVEGVVTLEALIGADGAVQSVAVISGDPMLVPSALESVKNWMYRPTWLNGMPVEVMTLIEVNFALQDRGIPRRGPVKKRL